MNFSISDDDRAIRDAVAGICRNFDKNYWLNKDQQGGFPHDFHAAFAEAGWLGIAMPTEYGGAGLGISEAALMLETVTASGAGTSGASALHMNIFGLHPVVVFGSEEQKQRWLPPLISGEHKACFAVTEPDAGLNTLKLKTRAVREGTNYIVHGQKIWISTAQVAHKVLLLARTSESNENGNKAAGLSLFYTDFDRSKIAVREIEKMGRKAVDSNELFIDGLCIPVEDRIGDEGEGFKYILHGLNPERILVAAEAVGLGRVALATAAGYAKDRVVFDRPIGQNQGIQHPLAKCWIELEAAELLYKKAAWLYDNHQSCGAEASAAKYFAGEAGYRACEAAVLTHGGMGYAKDFHVERYFRESMLPRLAPVSAQMVLSFIAERVLGLPKSY